MNFHTYTDYLGHDISINFDHVHFYRKANKEEKEAHPYAETRIETDCFTFYIREVIINASNHDV